MAKKAKNQSKSAKTAGKSRVALVGTYKGDQLERWPVMDCRQWIEGVRGELERVSDISSYLSGREIDSVSFRHSEAGECIGGEIWINDPLGSYCISDRFAYTVLGDKVVASELFSEELQERVVGYFSNRLSVSRG